MTCGDVFFWCNVWTEVSNVNPPRVYIRNFCPYITSLRTELQKSWTFRGVIWGDSLSYHNQRICFHSLHKLENRNASLGYQRLSILYHILNIQNFQIKIRSSLQNLYSHFEYYELHWKLCSLLHDLFRDTLQCLHTCCFFRFQWDTDSYSHVSQVIKTWKLWPHNPRKNTLAMALIFPLQELYQKTK